MAGQTQAWLSLAASKGWAALEATRRRDWDGCEGLRSVGFVGLRAMGAVMGGRLGVSGYGGCRAESHEGPAPAKGMKPGAGETVRG